MRKLTLSIGAALLVTTGVAVAAPQIAGHMQADMTRAQVQAKAADHFAKMDANGDGKLDAADRAARQAKVFDRIDADHDGAISRDEFAAKRAGRGERAGGDHAGMAAMDHGQADGQHRMTGHRMGGHRMAGHRMGGRMMARMADANNDGAITQAEFSAAALKHFDTVDGDHDGTLTAAERQAAHAAMKAKWESRKAARQAN